MLDYDICYLNDDGTLACSMTAMCRDDLHAKVLAHAMKFATCHRFEVWRDQRVVYERPQLFGEASVDRDIELMIALPPAAHLPAQQPFA